MLGYIIIFTLLLLLPPALMRTIRVFRDRGLNGKRFDALCKPAQIEYSSSRDLRLNGKRFDALCKPAQIEYSGSEKKVVDSCVLDVTKDDFHTIFIGNCAASKADDILDLPPRASSRMEEIRYPTLHGLAIRFQFPGFFDRSSKYFVIDLVRSNFLPEVKEQIRKNLRFLFSMEEKLFHRAHGNFSSIVDLLIPTFDGGGYKASSCYRYFRGEDGCTDVEHEEDVYGINLEKLGATSANNNNNEQKLLLTLEWTNVVKTFCVDTHVAYAYATTKFGFTMVQ